MDPSANSAVEKIGRLLVTVRSSDLEHCPRSAWTEAYAITVEDREFAFLKVGNDYLVITRRCPHKQADLARFGYLKLNEGTVLCTAHAHEYSLTTGKCLRADTCNLLSVYKGHANTADGTISVVLDDDSSRAVR